MITTIKLHQDTKRRLDAIKDNRETYDQLVRKLIDTSDAAALENKLIKGYQSMTQSEFEEFKEWESLP